MKERQQLIALYETGAYTVTALATQFGVSRKTVYAWLRRFQAHGLSGLEERSRAPQHHPNAVPAQVVEAVIQAKLANPSYGPQKLLPGKDTPPELAAAWPSASSRGRILARVGLVRMRQHRRRTPPWTQPFAACSGPNALWCCDFKGWFRTQDHSRCDPLTVTDAFSRFLLACDIVAHPDGGHVRGVLERLFREYGLPGAIRTDNGPPFASTGAGGLSPLSVWWVKLGIVPERIAPGHPEQNGRYERFHGTLKQETQKPPAQTPQAQQARYDAFRSWYNTQRPHQALGQVPPARLYRPSVRPYPEKVADLEYPHADTVRRVRSNGQVKWAGGLVFVSEALVGELVGITEAQEGMLVSFGPIALGYICPGRPSLKRVAPVVTRGLP